MWHLRKSEQLLTILLVFTELPQLRHIAAVNAVSARAMASRTGTALSTTNTQGAREHFSLDGVLWVVPRRVIRKAPCHKGRESINEHGLRAIDRRAFMCVACGDQAVAHRAAAGRAGAARPRVGERAQVARCRCLCPRLDRQPCPRRPAPAAHVHVKLVVWFGKHGRRVAPVSLLA